MKISYGLRAFGLYFLILGTLVWFTLDNAVERLNDSMRQSAESVMVDMSNLLAVIVESELSGLKEPTAEPLAELFNSLKSRSLKAQIYNVTKTNIDSSVILTNADGKVIYDSNGKHLGEDFSRWNDIKLTLEGKYGARTSYIDRSRTEPDDPKAMYVAAPIKHQQEIIGVVSLAKPINSLETHLVAESQQLQRYAFVLLLFALLIGYLLSLWFTYSLTKIRDYANAMASGKQTEQPQFVDSRLDELSDSIANLRSQLDGKEYVEKYVHSLTHELKTPLTSMGATVELLREPMNEQDRARFFDNLASSNQRMAALVDRMLTLARLEGQADLVNREAIELSAVIQKLINERLAIAERINVQFKFSSNSDLICEGDSVLLSQAVGNLLDNALRFCKRDSTIALQAEVQKDQCTVEIHNRGETIPDYALNKIFDRFYSLPANREGKQERKSTGLG